MRVKCILFLVMLIAASAALFPIQAFKVTGVSVSVSEAEYTGFCPHKFVFTGRITTNREGTVRYTWLRSDGIPRKTYTLAFAAGGTQTVTHEWELGGVMGTLRDQWAQIEILEPNSRFSNQAEFDLKCLPQARAERKIYRISGTLISYASQSAFLECLDGLQLKVNLTNGARVVDSKLINLTSSGISFYSFVLINAPGRYGLTVEPVHFPAHVLWERTDPASIWVTLTEADPDAINQNFRYYYGLTGMI